MFVSNNTKGPKQDSHFNTFGVFVVYVLMSLFNNKQ